MNFRCPKTSEVFFSRTLVDYDAAGDDILNLVLQSWLPCNFKAFICVK
jgi:hypothetical protein